MKPTKGEFDGSDLVHFNKDLRIPIGKLISLKSSSVYSPSFSWSTVTNSLANFSCTIDKPGSVMERDCKKRYKGDGEEEEGTAGWLRKKSRKGKSESHKIVDVFQTWGITGWGEGEGFWGGTTGFGEMDGCLKKKIKVEMMWSEVK